MIQKSYFFLLIFSSGMISCLDPIELDIPRGGSEAVVVEGKLVKGNPSSIEVSVQRIFVFDGSSQNLKINAVTLMSESGDDIKLARDNDGEFSQSFGPDNPFDVLLNESYKIRVELFDGRIVESAFEAVQAVGANDEVDLTLQNREVFSETRGDFVTRQKIILDLNSQIRNIQQDPKRFRWTVERYFKLTDSPDAYQIRDPQDRTMFVQPKTCYIRDKASLTKTFIFDGFASDQDQLDFETEIFDGTLNDYRLADTMYFSVVQEALSEGAFNYYDEISKVLERTGSMFDPPAGKIKSNFVNVNDPEDEIFGYFYASEQEQTRVMVTPDQVGNPSPLCPAPTGEGWRPGQCPFTDCCDCLTVPNSSLEAPDFWNR